MQDRLFNSKYPGMSDKIQEKLFDESIDNGVTILNRISTSRIGDNEKGKVFFKSGKTEVVAKFVSYEGFEIERFTETKPPEIYKGRSI